jgi:hypothetical protein
MSLKWHWRRCNTLRVLRYATQIVTLLAAPQPSFGQLLCPSPIFVHSLLRSAPFHPFAPKHLLQGMAVLTITQKQCFKGCTYHSASMHHNGSLGFIPLHSVVHSLQKGSVHPLPILVLACAAAGCVPGFHWHKAFAYALTPTHKSLS